MLSRDGGPAFPTAGEAMERHGERLDYVGHQHGMTLLDWFAGQAMQGIVGSIDSEESYTRLKLLAASEGVKVSTWIARDSYKQAEAMLREKHQRETKKGE